LMAKYNARGQRGADDLRRAEARLPRLSVRPREATALVRRAAG
jgi:hypothetical protein